MSLTHYSHLNSVDKFENGDFLISSRYTNCIYRIDGTNGKVVWRFGGKANDFKMMNHLNFSRQHHARILKENGTQIEMSLLDNAAGGYDTDRKTQTAQHSRGLFVQLNTGTTPMTAQLLREYHRPDGELSRQRGSVQQLDNGNVFICWSGKGYITEHSPDGDVLLDMQFQTGRMYNTYRGYKFEVTLHPTEPPVAKSMAYGTTQDTMTTIVWMSWNGATEMQGWNIYAISEDEIEEKLIGKVKRQGFESVFQYHGYVEHLIVEALDADGNAMNRTDHVHTGTPPGWFQTGFLEDDAPQPLELGDIQEWTSEEFDEEPVANEEDEDGSADDEDEEEEEHDDYEHEMEDEDGEHEHGHEEESHGSLSLSSAADASVILVLVIFAAGSIGFVWWLMRRKGEATDDASRSSWLGPKYADSFDGSATDDDDTAHDEEAGYRDNVKLERISEDPGSREELADPDDFEMSPRNSDVHSPLIATDGNHH
jgi:hypothetical protein